MASMRHWHRRSRARCGDAAAARQPADRGQRRHRQDLDHRRAVSAAGARPWRRGRLRTAAGAGRNPGDDVHRGGHARTVRPHPQAAARSRTRPSAAASRHRPTIGCWPNCWPPIRGRRRRQPRRMAARDGGAGDGRCRGAHHRRLVPAHAARTCLRQRLPVRRGTDADESAMLAEAARDYWRLQVYPLARRGARCGACRSGPMPAVWLPRRARLVEQPWPAAAGDGSLGELIDRLRQQRAAPSWPR